MKEDSPFTISLHNPAALHPQRVSMYRLHLKYMFLNRKKISISQYMDYTRSKWVILAKYFTTLFNSSKPKV